MHKNSLPNRYKVSIQLVSLFVWGPEKAISSKLSTNVSIQLVSLFVWGLYTVVRSLIALFDMFPFN